LNDTAKSIYPYTVQLPYLNMALAELQEFLELNQVPITEFQSFVILAKAGTNKLVFQNLPDNKLPADMVEPELLWERQAGQSKGFTRMTRVKVLPIELEGIATNTLGVYTWQNEEVTFFPATCDIEVKIDYLRQMFFEILSEDDEIVGANLQSFVQYRTAALCSEFIGENQSRAMSLNNYAALAMDRVIGIGTKSKQAIMTRRRPFRQGFKRTVQF